MPAPQLTFGGEGADTDPSGVTNPSAKGSSSPPSDPPRPTAPLSAWSFAEGLSLIERIFLDRFELTPSQGSFASNPWPFLSSSSTAACCLSRVAVAVCSARPAEGLAGARTTRWAVLFADAALPSAGVILIGAFDLFAWGCGSSPFPAGSSCPSSDSTTSSSLIGERVFGFASKVSFFRGKPGPAHKFCSPLSSSKFAPAGAPARGRAYGYRLLLARPPFSS